jgi:tripartite-type tricarboxylate transporter receptor subunit TctC
VRGLAVASPKRAASLPDVPTFSEAGYRGVEVDTRYGIMAPASTPLPIINRLQGAIVKALGTNELRVHHIDFRIQLQKLSTQMQGAAASG